MVLNKKVNLKDLEAVNYELYKVLPGCCACSSSCSWSCCWLMPLCHRENDIVACSMRLFSVTEDCFGEHDAVELRLGGAAQDVTKVNREEYVNLVVMHQIAEQFRAFMEELGDVLLLDLLLVR